MFSPKGVNSFDDYELSPDDREEVRLMFRIDSGLNLSTDGSEKVENGQSKVESDVGFPRNTGNGLFEKSKGLPSKMSSKSLDIQQTSSMGCAAQKSHRSVSFDAECTNGRMTDEMRDFRFNRIVMENLEKYPLDYDRLRLEKEAETAKERGRERSNGFDRKALKEEGGFLCSHGRDIPSRCPLCSETDGSSMEPDAFWKMLHDDNWNEVEGSSLSDEGTPVQGNSLPLDTWISPPVVAPGMSTGSTTYPARNNDHITCELEGQFCLFAWFVCFFAHSLVYPFSLYILTLLFLCGHSFIHSIALIHFVLLCSLLQSI